MPIPQNIQREHLFQAIIKIHRDGVPQDREADRWIVLYEEKKYPCKLLISWANLYANGVELNPDPGNFNTYMAQDYLIEKGFVINEI